jgi:hypothetical protein
MLQEAGEDCMMRSFITYVSPNMIRVIKSRRMRLVGHVASMGEMGKTYIILVGKPEGKRPLGRPRRRWEENNMRIKLWEIVDWMHLP